MPFKPKTLSRWRLASLFPLLIAVALAGCGQTDVNLVNHTPNILDPQGPVAKSESDLFWFILAVSTFVFVAVVSMLVYSIWRFRDRPGAAAPRQTHGDTRLEIAWTVVPSLFLLGVLVATITTMFGIQQPASANTITVNAIGHQWWWEFKYPDQNIVTADEMWIPTGAVVHINLISDNVIHSFWVPQLGGKTDVIPGHDNAMWLKADTVGWYRGECAEFCGAQHAHMDFVVHAVSPSDYQSWIAQQQSPAAQSSDALAQQGAKYFVSSPCIGCHMVNGVTNSAGAKLIGPNLTHFGSRQWIAGGVVDNTPANLKSWIMDAQSIKPGSDMPTFSNLSPAEVDALVAYLESLK
ncbi:MAG TPA: cytochrome c oxidase subunit II [Ktedonobacterales bacterium]